MGEVTMSANNQSAQGGDNHINLYEPHVWKHHTKVAGLEWKNPVGTASGTFQYAAVRWFYDVSQLGAVCTKGASPVPWEGNPSPRTAESPAANINAVGLQNPGIDHYLAEDLPKLKAAGAFVISNVAGHCDDDYAAVVEKLADSGHAGNQRQLPERFRRRHERGHRPGGPRQSYGPAAPDDRQADDRQTHAERHRHHRAGARGRGTWRRRVEHDQHAQRHAH
jgi:hypothetical protein